MTVGGKGSVSYAVDIFMKMTPSFRPLLNELDQCDAKGRGYESTTSNVRAHWQDSLCHRAPQLDGTQLRLIQTGNPRSCQFQAA